MIKIIVDSGTDVPKEVAEKYSISVVPLRVFLDDKEYKDSVDITEDELLKFMETGGMPKTSQPTYDDVKCAFDEAIEKGYNQIIAINISSGLSGTYNVFKLAQSRIEKDNPKVKIEVIDSLSISVSSGLLAYKAAKMIESGDDFDSIIDTLKNIVKSKLKVYYTIPTLKYLKAGGRIGAVAASFGEMLSLKPVISCNKDGKYYTITKAFGMLKAVNKMILTMKEFAQSDLIEAVSIARTGDKQSTLSFVDKIKKEADKLGVEKIFISKINASMLVHTGDGLVGYGIMLK